jgi:hypothetical protein
MQFRVEKPNGVSIPENGVELDVLINGNISKIKTLNPRWWWKNLSEGEEKLLVEDIVKYYVSNEDFQKQNIGESCLLYVTRVTYERLVADRNVDPKTHLEKYESAIPGNKPILIPKVETVLSPKEAERRENLRLKRKEYFDFFIKGFDFGAGVVYSFNKTLMDPKTKTETLARFKSELAKFLELRLDLVKDIFIQKGAEKDFKITDEDIQSLAEDMCLDLDDHISSRVMADEVLKYFLKQKNLSGEKAVAATLIYLLRRFLSENMKLKVLIDQYADNVDINSLELSEEAIVRLNAKDKSMRIMGYSNMVYNYFFGREKIGDNFSPSAPVLISNRDVFAFNNYFDGSTSRPFSRVYSQLVNMTGGEGILTRHLGTPKDNYDARLRSLVKRFVICDTRDNALEF